MGEKIDQTQKFLQDGTRVPVTEVKVPDNAVVQIRNYNNGAFSAFQLGVGRKKNPTKAALGHAKKAGLDYAPLAMREVKNQKSDQLTTDVDLPKPGEAIKVEDVFKQGDKVDVTGVSKGKGFAGVVKRHNFRGGPKTHGQSDRLRAPGSIGQTTTPGRVYKGKRMAGRMGQDKITIKNLTVIDVDPANKRLYVSGLIPGAKNSIVYITRTGEDKKFVGVYKEEPKTTEEPQISSDAAVEAPKIEEKVEEKKEAKENKSTKTETKETKAADKAKSETIKKDTKGDK